MFDPRRVAAAFEVVQNPLKDDAAAQPEATETKGEEGK